jgi:mersacidin/lichenicidin family type 2 lantibiotic
MNRTDVIRAWKDPLYRARLSPEEAAALPEHPSGLVELREEDLKMASGGVIVTTFRTCTEYSFNHWHSCCP